MLDSLNCDNVKPYMNVLILGPINKRLITPGELFLPYCSL